MKLRRWQEKVVDEFPDIIKNYRKFILKAPTGAGKTVLASEIIDRFYSKKKVVVLCHRIVLLEQLEKGLSNNHKVKKLGFVSSIASVCVFLSVYPAMPFMGIVAFIAAMLKTFFYIFRKL